jgi:hypothetical protein
MMKRAVSSTGLSTRKAASASQGERMRAAMRGPARL